MPTVEASRKDLESLVGKSFGSREEIEEALMYAKAELDSVDGDMLQIDVKDTNRPDLWSAEGIARQIRGCMGLEKGLPKYRVEKSGLVVRIEKSVLDVRPKTVCAVVKGVEVSNDFLVQIIQLQEKIAMTFGRKRKEAAIGIYDYDRIHGGIRYYGAEPRKTKFVPLEFSSELDLNEIIELHPKGREYGHLLAGKKLYPIFEDSKGNILSMPPIINSSYSGKVSDKTRNIFIEVSGFADELINTALNVVVAAFADRGGRIYSVKIVGADGKAMLTPELKPRKASLRIDELKRLSGLQLKEREIPSLLARARYDAKLMGKKVECLYPAYRNDILHEVDVIEDIIIAYGYNRIEPLPLKMAVVGSEMEETRRLECVREVCIGIGLQEVLTFTLTSKEKQADAAGVSSDMLVEIANPVSSNWAVFRQQLFPELLEFLSKNKHVPYPQKIFEVGRVVALDSKTETGVCERNRLCIALCDRQANFTIIKSVLEAVCGNLGIEYRLEPANNPAFDESKSALLRLSSGGRGIAGEIKESSLACFGLGIPVAVLEIEL